MTQKLYNSDEGRRAIVGRFFSTLEKAKAEVKKLRDVFRREFVIMETDNGYLVVSSHQLKNE